MADEFDKIVEEKANALVAEKQKSASVETILNDRLKNTDNIKEAIDTLATATALKEEDTISEVVGQKKKELTYDAEAKANIAETSKVNEETKKVNAQREKQIAEFDKVISAKQKEVEQLKADSDKADAFFNSNQDILKYLGIRSKKTLKTMQVLMIPATIMFIVVQILLFPLTFCGFVFENIIEILGGVCGSIKNNALKITISILVILLVVGVGIGAYYGVATLIQNRII